ncbi:E3 ubiquitin-protein ligase RNF182-like [Sarcophilus harrisii]|uniref:E3 ubiquitin-protein ligase RNF182 n=1 Tax=Sarcophilus harrisii TaxID=9305 RepID=A0A7N4NG87_SARHA
MSCPQIEEKLPYEELECKICYQKFNVCSRKPKILDCLHRVCARCLTEIAHTGDGSTTYISCPFCRYNTEMQGEKVAELPDDTNIMSKLLLKDKTTWNSESSEVVLTPKNLISSSPSHGFSNCLAITLLEVQQNWTRTLSQNTISDAYGGHSMDSVSVNSYSQIDQDLFSKICNHVPRIIMWLLGLFYFGSLPLGIYLLVIQKVTLGIVCVSLVPSSLTICLVYVFCQCLYQEIGNCSLLS